MELKYKFYILSIFIHNKIFILTNTIIKGVVKMDNTLKNRITEAKVNKSLETEKEIVKLAKTKDSTVEKDIKA